MAEQIALVLAQKIPSTYPRLCYEEIWASLITRVLPSVTLPQNLNLIFLLFCHGTTMVASVTNLVQTAQVYHTERTPLFTTLWT